MSAPAVLAPAGRPAAPAPGDAPAVPAGLGEPCIMLVDDEPVVNEVVRLYLEDAGYREFVVTEDSTRAVELAVERRPDLVLLDLMMPEMDGFEVLDRLRAAPATRHLPVVVLTSVSDAGAKLRALELGATDFLAKPVDPSELTLRVRNILSMKAYQDRLAFFDRTTDLPNRRWFLERMADALADAARRGSPCSVIQIGLDRFKQINDALGYGTGDEALRAVATRLRDGLADLVGAGGEPAPEGVCVARTGGDEFSVLLPGWRTGEAVGAAEGLRDLVGRALAVGGEPLHLNASVGIAGAPAHGESVDAVLAHAAQALSFVKRRGGDGAMAFSEAVRSWARERLELERDLRRAIADGALRVDFQPKVDLRTGAVAGAEALLRWDHPVRGAVGPGTFIPLAEESGLIVSLGTWVLNEACRRVAAWRGPGGGEIGVAVNVSPRQFREPDLGDTVREALERSGIAPGRLTLEVTEGLLMQDVARAERSLEALASLGVRISIDDFGTGYSSLAYLKRFRVHELKIDQSFLAEVPEAESDVALVHAVIAMARSLGLQVVAEGVERPEQREFLARAGCDGFQGFLFSRALRAESFAELLRG